MDIQSGDVEIVVHDNSDNKIAMTDIMSLRNYSNLHYIHCADKLSMAENFERGLESSSGEYITFIGDDDGVNPEIIDALTWAKREGLDALVGCSAASYDWPDVVSKFYGKRFSGMLTISHFSGKVVYPEPLNEIYYCLRTAGYGFARLPKSYHGIVKREYMDMVFQKAGTYFPGPTPDMSNAVALACIIKRYAYIDYPLFISGHGRTSGGGAGAENMHDWSLQSAPWFSQRAVSIWSDMVPKFCCGETLWAVDVIQALQAMGCDNLIIHFNKTFLYARCVVFYKHHNQLTFDMIYRFMGKDVLSRLRTAISFTYYYLWTWAQRLGSLLKNIFRLCKTCNNQQASNLKDIGHAMDSLKRVLRLKCYYFDKEVGPCKKC